MPKININIADRLTKEEREVFDLLTKVSSLSSTPVTLRVAGGWVRDKLLGVESDDIDIMVDTMSGEDFAKLVTTHLGTKSAHVIRENPEKSKHVETAKAYIPLSSGKTQEIDFARARKEVYNDGSRIPDIKPATPQEDAMRRDLSINSLFYNLSTKQIEDFTGKGIQDLITNTIRTPINPLQTFKDDPLRIFRVIRFAAKYNGEIDPETYAALKDDSLKEDIRQKISKERIGTEFKKMLKNPNAIKAITLLKETGLFSGIIDEALKGTKYEGKMTQLEMDQNNPNHKLNLWEHTMQVVYNVLDRYQDAEDEKRIVMILGALTHDLGKLFSEIQKKKDGTERYPGHEDGYTTYVGHEEESAEIVQHILKYLKLEPYVQQVSGLARYHMQPHSLVRNDESGEKALRKFIRRMGELSLNWLDVFNLSVSDAYSKGKEIDPKTVSEYKNLEERLQQALISMTPTNEAKIEPVLNGFEIMKALNIKPGAHMKEMSDFVKELKDENPSISKEEAIEKLKSRFQPSPSTDSNIKQAAKDKEKTSFCSKHLLVNKTKEIHEAIESGDLYEANTIMKNLKDEYGKDETVSRMIAINTLKILSSPDGEKFRDNDILQFLFDKAKDNFFDYVLGSYVLGVLLLINTATKEDVIMEVATRNIRLSPGIMRSVLDMLQGKTPFRKEEYIKIREMLSGQ